LPLQCVGSAQQYQGSERCGIGVPLPEGSSYLGFIFARAPSAEQAEAALRTAHTYLRVVVMPLWRGVSVLRFQPLLPLIRED
jgi:hypothetical protein